MTTNIVRVIAAIVDTKKLTLYLENGDVIYILQGDPRLRAIMDVATPAILSQGYADIDITVINENPYAAVEKESNGMVRFFRVAKDKLVKLFQKEEHIPPMEVEVTIAKTTSITQSMVDTVNEIIRNAVPSTNPLFEETGLGKQGNLSDTDDKTFDDEAPDTVIAVVDGQVIPGMEKIRSQFTKAEKMGSAVGVTNFLQRISKVIGKRKHSIDDLLTFMEKADLPIADDGTIIIYKALNYASNVDNNTFTDAHTGKVKQWVGAYVCMDEALVDPDRSKDCSNGLHVARRGYLSSFHCNVCVLAKVAPEDVIAVPTNDARKMRVSGYHIIARLSDEEYQLLLANKPITGLKTGAIILANAIAGHHTEKTHIIKIGGAHGSNISVTDLKEFLKVSLVYTPPKEPVTAIEDNHDNKDTPVSPKDIAKAKTSILTRREEVMHKANAYNANPTQEGYDELVAIKRAAKVSWEKLGILALTPFVASEIKKDTSSSVKVKVRTLDKPSGKTALFAEPDKRHPPAPTAEAKAAVSGRSKVKPKVKKFAPVKPVAKGTYKERIAAIDVVDQESAMDALILKRMSKKGWPELGVSPEKANHILKLTNQLK